VWRAVINAVGSLDRAALSRVVFADAGALERLTTIVHPLVRAAAALRESSFAPDAIVVHVVPLLFEGDYWKSCAVNVLVVAPPALRVERVVARDGLSAADVRARMAAQIDPARALAMADFVVNNDGDLATLRARAHHVYLAIGGRSVA
jgi:dephospho-CoA kinase